MRTIKPNTIFVVAKPDEAETTRKSGFIVTESAKEDPKTAVVIATGSGVSEFHKGDRIIYKEYTTTEVKLDGEQYIMLEHEDILGVIVEVGE